MTLKLSMAVIAGIVISAVMTITTHFGILPIHDPEHFTGVITGTPDHAVAVGYTEQAGFIAVSAALEYR